MVHTCPSWSNWSLAGKGASGRGGAGAAASCPSSSINPVQHNYSSIVAFTWISLPQTFNLTRIACGTGEVCCNPDKWEIFRQTTQRYFNSWCWLFDSCLQFTSCPQQAPWNLQGALMAEEPLFYISHPGPGAGAGTANGLKLDTSPLCWLYLWKNNTREHGILKYHAMSNLLLNTKRDYLWTGILRISYGNLTCEKLGQET